MNQTSKQICNTVKDLNKKDVIAAYSIDAGFHVFVFTLVDNCDRVKMALSEVSKIERVIETTIDKNGVE